MKNLEELIMSKYVNVVRYKVQEGESENFEKLYKTLIIRGLYLITKRLNASLSPFLAFFKSEASFF